MSLEGVAGAHRRGEVVSIRLATIALLAAAVLAACGEVPLAPDADRLADAERAGREAVARGAWRHAADAYARAFALADPVSEMAARRAHLAFETGRALAEAAVAARTGDATAPSHANGTARAAHLWLDEAFALDPSLTAVGEIRDRLRADDDADAPR